MLKVTRYLEDHPRTCKWLITMVKKSPKDRVVPLVSGLTCFFKGGWLETTHKSWDDPPSRVDRCFLFEGFCIFFCDHETGVVVSSPNISSTYRGIRKPI